MGLVMYLRRVILLADTLLEDHPTGPVNHNYVFSSINNHAMSHKPTLTLQRTNQSRVNFSQGWVLKPRYSVYRYLVLFNYRRPNVNVRKSDNCLYQRLRPAGVHACTRGHRPSTLCCALLLSRNSGIISWTNSKLLKEMMRFAQFLRTISSISLLFISQLCQKGCSQKMNWKCVIFRLRSK